MRNPIGWLVLLASVGFGQNWEMRSIVPEIGAAYDADIVTDSLCLPHVAFNRSGHGLTYASWTGDSWSFEYPLSVSGWDLDLCLDRNDNPHIVYRSSTLCYTWRDGGTWHTETVAAHGDRPSLALARDGTPHIGFVEWNSDTVKYAYKSADTWNVLTVPAYQADPFKDLIGVSLALDTSDRPGIAVSWFKYNSGHDSLWFSFFEYDGEDWYRSDVDSLEPTPVGVPIPRVRSDPTTNLFHVVYTSGVYATGKGGNWHVEEAPVPDGACDFVLYRGQPHIVTSGQIPMQYTWRTTEGWETEMVGNYLFTCRCPAKIAVDRTGRPHLVFDSGGDESLYYARRLSAGTEEPAPAIVQQKLQLLVYPNPALRAFTLEFRVRSTATAVTRLCDALGRIVWSQDEKVYPGQYCRRFCLSASISPGIYFLQVETDSQRSIEKVVLQ
jgi:hypothetical protein